MKKMTAARGLILCLLVILAVPLIADSSFAQRKDWPKAVTIGTGSIGGVAYLHGGAVAKVIYDTMKISAVAEVNGGSVHNVKLVIQKKPRCLFPRRKRL